MMVSWFFGAKLHCKDRSHSSYSTRQGQLTCLQMLHISGIQLKALLAIFVADFSTRFRSCDWLEPQFALQGFTEELRQWDVSFWAERLREAKFNITDEELRPYFALPNVLKGLFQVFCALCFAICLTDTIRTNQHALHLVSFNTVLPWQYLYLVSRRSSHHSRDVSHLLDLCCLS